MPSGSSLSKYGFRRKKNQPEAKKPIDLATALPSRDEFRTSLLMPNLSARFSMLREQDDPNTKMGKASDDSVLFPKRASRINMFNYGDLADIAEVASISGSIRPPFANERSSTYSSGDAGYATDDDRNVMTRSRPGQGNKFFGGRQKVYMISTKDGETASGRPKGRAVYDDDINLAAYKPSMDFKHSSEDNELDFDTDYNSKRETSSSTNSGPFDSRSSTAATSVASYAPSPATQNVGFANKLNSFSTNGVDRPIKGKRLYGQGLDQLIHEQQSSALNRLNSIQRNFGPGMVQYGIAPTTKIVTNSDISEPKSAPSAGNSPVAQASTNSTTGFDFGTTQESPTNHVIPKQFGLMNTPMSPPMNSTDPTLVAALDANDLGKATATGAFNKPAGPYNDEQFAQRQLQLQQGRETPPQRAFSRTGINVAATTITPRERNGSLASQRSGFSFQSSQPRTQASIREQTSISHLRTCETPDMSEQASNGAYLASLSGSEYGSEPSSPSNITTKSLAQTAFTGGVVDPALRHRKYEHDDRHPAFNSSMDLHEGNPDLEIVTSLPLNSHLTSSTPSIVTTIDKADNVEEPEGGLSDLVRGHLRNISNQSSVYPDTPPRTSHGDISESPVELHPQHGFQSTTAPAENPLAARARALLDNANEIRKAGAKQNGLQNTENLHSLNRSLEDEVPQQTEDMPEIPWQEHLKSHQRQGSSDTQREREDFASELADRRKQVQSNLRNYVSDNQQIDRRVNDHSPPRNGAFGLLKKASFGNITNRGENNSRSMKPAGAQDSQRLPLGHDSRYRLQDSKSFEHLNRMGSSQATGPAFRDRNFNSESRQAYTRETSDPKARGMERSPPTKNSLPNPNGYNFTRPSAGMNNHQGAYRPAGRSRKYSPPSSNSRVPETGNVSYMRSISAQGRNPPPFRSATPNGSHLPSPGQSHNNSNFNDTPRHSPMSPVFSGQAASENLPFTHGSTPTLNGRSSRKGSINKSEISTPTLISGTSSMNTIELPHGASLNNGMAIGMADVPPLPPINPRRRGQNFFSPFGNRSTNNGSSSSISSPLVTPMDERRPYTMGEPEAFEPPMLDQGENKPRFRTRLRKSSSAGENMSHRARHQALKELERIPRSPNLSAPSKGMF